MIAQALSTRRADNATSGAADRAGAYGEQYVIPVTNKEFAFADEGSYFLGITPTPGTGIIGHAAPTTFDETKPYLTIYNSSALKRIYLQFIRFNVTAVSVAAVRVQYTLALDDGIRRSSAGTQLTVNNVNGDSDAAFDGNAFVGAVVAAAATPARRILGHHVIRGTIDVVEDLYTLSFGAPDGTGPGSSRVATVQEVSRVCVPVIIGPGQTFLLHQWSASQTTGPTMEVQVGMVQR